METHWVNGVKKHLKKPRDSRVHQDVVIIRGDAKEFMEGYIKEVQDKEHCYFRSPVCPRQGYYHYGCDRGNHSSGKSNGEATKTRANSCKAYISFKVIMDAGVSGAIIQKMLQHTGHDEDNSKQKNRIHPDLHSLVEIWLQQGCSTSEILIKSYDWAQQNGHVDKKDRRFYLTPDDIRLLKKNLKRVGDSDSVSVDHLVSTELQDNICFYQPLHNEQPFILVLQTPFQKTLLEENPHPMLFIDASYKGITAYGYAFYALLLINKTGRGVPFAYFILSKETTETVSLCLQKLQLSNPSFYPRSVMMDRDLRVLNAIKSIFPNTKPLLCWFHVLQAVSRWLVKTDGGHLTPEQRNVVIQAMASMKACLTEEEFLSVSAKKCSEIDTFLGSSHVTAYLKKNWFTYAELWVSFGRKFYHCSSETNNKAERFFLTLKYQFLRGQANRRVDQLLLLLCGDVEKYYSYMDDLSEAGRLKLSTSAAHQVAALLFENGIGADLDIKAGQCYVPSQSTNTAYKIDMLHFTCECTNFQMGNICKHLLLVKMEVDRRGIDIEEMRNNKALEIISLHLYQQTESEITIFDSEGTMSIVNKKTPTSCTCIANSFGEKCVCIHVAHILEPQHILTDSKENAQVSEASHDHPPIQAMLSELLEWSRSEEFEHMPELYNTIQKAHKLAFGKFTAFCKKRKITPLHGYRKKIKKASLQKAVENFKNKRRART